MATLSTVHIEFENGSYVVKPIWDGVDRPYVGGYSTGKNISLARRLVNAIQAGEVWMSEPKVCTDINNQTYVCASLALSCRRLNSELAKYGF